MRGVKFLTSAALLTILLASPVQALAQNVSFPYFGGLGGGVPLLPCTGIFQYNGTDATSGDPSGAQFVDPKSTGYFDENGDFQQLKQCTSLCDGFTLFNNLLIFGLSVLITIILPIMIMIGAGYIITGGGNPGQIQTGTKIITSTLIGIVIAVFSFFLVNQVLQIIMERSYGDAIRAAVEAQTGTKLNADEVAKLVTWNNISCSPTSGQIKTGTDGLLNPGTKTPGGVTTNPGTPKQPTTRTYPEFYCGINADLTNKTYSCTSGWKKDSRCPTDRPQLCAVSASDSCSAVCKNEQAVPSFWTGLRWSSAADVKSACVCQGF